jgi:glycosyltransferase involved in cell wall biosynthesis
MCTWEERQTVPLAIESTKDFVDRYIVVDKDSKDGTIDVIKKCRDEWKLDMDIYNKPNLLLGEARLFAFRKADEDWILIQDGDEIFHTDGPNSIFNLKKLLRFRSVSYAAPMTTIAGDFLHTRKDFPKQPAHPFLHHNNHTFYLEIRGDGPAMVTVKIYLSKVYKFNCNVKSPERMFLRPYWWEWCIQTDAFKTYRSVEEYAKAKLGTENLEEHIKKWYKDYYASVLAPYDEKKFGYYPLVIRKYIKRGRIRGYA